jgi:tetratricopeptide (TPR) repeat protein
VRLGVAISVVLACAAGARPSAAADAAAPPPSPAPPIVLVLPFVNGTGDAGLDWIGVALQDAVNIDLWYVGALHTWDLPNMVGQSKEAPSALAVDDPAAAAKLAGTLRADLVFAGRYRSAGDQIAVTARLIRLGDAGPPAEQTGSAPLGQLTDLISKLVLALLDQAKVAVGTEERARILITKTRSAAALQTNARGFEAYARYGLKQDEALLKESLQLFERAVQADAGYAEAWNNLAWAQFVAREYAKAVANFERAIGLRLDLVDALVGLGKTKLSARPDDQSALPPLEAAARLNPNLAGHRLELAEALELQGQGARALQELEAAERIVKGRIPYLEANVHLKMAGLLMRKGDPAGAAARLEQARDVYRVAGSKVGEAGALRAMGDLAAGRRDFAAARRYYTEALALVKQLGDRRGEGLLLNALGMAALNGGEASAAERHFSEGLTASRDAGDKSAQALLLFNLGLVVAAQGDLGRAQGLLFEALLLVRQLGDDEAEKTIQERLKQIRDALGDRDAT